MYGLTSTVMATSAGGAMATTATCRVLGDYAYELPPIGGT